MCSEVGGRRRFFWKKNRLLGFLYLCLCGAAITAPFLFFRIGRFSNAQSLRYFPLLAYRLQSANFPKRFEHTLGLVPFGGKCVLILPLKVGAEENKGANCSSPTFAVSFFGATTLQCKSNRNRPQKKRVGFLRRATSTIELLQATKQTYSIRHLGFCFVRKNFPYSYFYKKSRPNASNCVRNAKICFSFCRYFG